MSETKEVKKELVSFLDAVSRTIIGKKVNETDEYIDIENPVVVNLVPVRDPQTGQERMSLQLFTIFFKEFLADKNDAVTFRFKRKNITESVDPITFDFRLQAQYEQVVNPQVQPQAQPQAPVAAPAAPAQGGESKVKLFD